MKRLLIAIGLAVLYCAWRKRHEPKRHPLGGFRCVDCWRALADLEEAGYKDGAAVDPNRRQGPRGGPRGHRTSRIAA